jgi:hypothetical protein
MDYSKFICTVQVIMKPCGLKTSNIGTKTVVYVMKLMDTPTTKSTIDYSA